MFRSVKTLMLAVAVLLTLAANALAVGWTSTDFLVFGAPNFPDRTGVFDQNFSFKGYLFTGWNGLQAMNFDQQGRLVTFNTFTQEVRVYDSTGALVGGFDSTTSPMLTSGGDIQVLSNGDFLLGTSANGVREFTPQGAFVRQFGAGRLSSIAVLPAHNLWAGSPANLAMNVFDTDTGLQTGSFILDQQTRPTHMQYSASTNSVLCIDLDRDAGGIFERDLAGNLIRQFHVPFSQVAIGGGTRGPGGDVFGTPGDFTHDIARWDSIGNYLESHDIYSADVIPTRILWAGLAPEPSSAGAAIIGLCALHIKRPARSRSPSHF